MSDRTASAILSDVSQSLSGLGNTISSHTTVMGLLSSAEVIRSTPIRSQNGTVDANVVSIKQNLVVTVTTLQYNNDPNDLQNGYFGRCLEGW